MATGFTSLMAGRILDSRIKNSYVALSTTTPDQDGNNFTEPDPYNGYQRQQITNWDNTIPAQIANDRIVFLFEAVGNIGTVTHLGLSKNSTVGSSVFLMAQLTSPLTVASGYVPLIRPYGLVIGLDKSSLETYPQE